MAKLEEDGTVSSKLKPIVTVLTESLIHDFSRAYRYEGDGVWTRVDEEGGTSEVDVTQITRDVEEWLMHLQGDYGGHEAASRVVTMVRKNPGWVTLLANRVVHALVEKSGKLGTPSHLMQGLEGDAGIHGSHHHECVLVHGQVVQSPRNLHSQYQPPARLRPVVADQQQSRKAYG